MTSSTFHMFSIFLFCASLQFVSAQFSDSILSDDELDELCYPGFSGFGTCGAFMPFFGGSCQGGTNCMSSPGSILPGFGFWQPLAYRGYGSQLGNINGYSAGNNVNCIGAGQNNLGYGQGSFGGQYGNCYANAQSLRRAGERGYNNNFSDEVLIRQSNDQCVSGTNRYDNANANVAGSAARLAGSRNYGNQNNCYNNAAGMNNVGQGGSFCTDDFSSGNSGCVSPYACC